MILDADAGLIFVINVGGSVLWVGAIVRREMKNKVACFKGRLGKPMGDGINSFWSYILLWIWDEFCFIIWFGHRYGQCFVYFDCSSVDWLSLFIIYTQYIIKKTLLFSLVGLLRLIYVLVLIFQIISIVVWGSDFNCARIDLMLENFSLDTQKILGRKFYVIFSLCNFNYLKLFLGFFFFFFLRNQNKKT